MDTTHQQIQHQAITACSHTNPSDPFWSVKSKTDQIVPSPRINYRDGINAIKPIAYHSSQLLSLEM
jgi:hypothetical protein